MKTMKTMRNSKRNSLPAIKMNSFMVGNFAAKFELAKKETPKEKRERSPCGVVEASQRKMEVRKEKERKEAMRAKMRRQKDPYAEQSSDGEEEEYPDQEAKVCGHVNHSVNFNLVRRKLKEGQPIGECSLCRKGHTQNQNDSLRNDNVDEYEPVIWLCVYCGHQGCDRNTREKHSLLHYRTPHSDPHCLILNTQAWNVWCYECDSEVLQTSSKKLHQVIEYIKRQKDMAPRRNAGTNVVVNRKTKDVQDGGTTVEPPSISVNKTPVKAIPDNSKDAKNQRNLKAGSTTSLPKVKGLNNLGNTCFFNSVMQSLAQTHYLLQLLDIQCQSGQRVYLPGRPKAPIIGEDGEITFPEEKTNENGRISVAQRRKLIEKKKEEPPETEETMELKPLDLMLPEGGSLTLAMSVFLKDMHQVGRHGILNPGHLYGQICKRSTQFQGYEQQDSHELLRCMLDAIRNEEILRTKRSILRAFALSEKTDPNSVAPRLKNMIKGYGKQATHTIVDQIFGGHLISTVFCEECHWSSQVFEPFMDLSLPINEEKGKPKKSTPSDEEISMLDCFPLGKNNSSQTQSKHHQKKQKKNEKKDKGKKGNPNRKRGGGATLTPDCIRANGEDFEDDKLKRRMTEKMTPEEVAERERLHQVERAKRGKKSSVKRGESFKFKQKSRIRNQQKLVEEAEEDNSSEDLEYDQLSDDDDDSFGEGKYLSYNKRKTSKNPSRNNSRVPSPSPSLHCNDSTEHKKGSEVTKGEEGEEEEDESSSEEDSSEESSEEDSDGSGSPVASSKKKGSSTEMSDADVEDNTDSDRGKKAKSIRHPSIVIISESENMTSREGSILDNRSQSDELPPRPSSIESSDVSTNPMKIESEKALSIEPSIPKNAISEPGSSVVVETIVYSKETVESVVLKADNSSVSITKTTDQPSRRAFLSKGRESFRKVIPNINSASGNIYENVASGISLVKGKSTNMAKSIMSRLYLKTSHSRNSLDYSTDTSERYFTATERDCNGLDTGDDLDCDSQRNNKDNYIDQSHMDEMALKVRELKIKRKSNSKENLLDIQERHKRGSTETLHTFNERPTEEGDDTKRKIRQMKKLKQEWVARSLTTLTPRYQCRSQECSVMSCITNFTAPELLTGSNKVICDNCTKIAKQNSPDGKCEKVKSNASKQMLILSPPAVLTLHMKRFHHVGFNLTKVNRYVQFPLVLDIAPFTSSISQALGNMSKGQSNVLYGLYGVVEHTGRLNSGHYVAYVRSRPLDPSRTNKQFLNLKPSSQFEVNSLVAEMAEKIEVAGVSFRNDLKGDAQTSVKVDIEELEEEVKSGRWFHVSDSYVAEVNMERVMRAQAYLLFYERLV